MGRCAWAFLAMAVAVAAIGCGKSFQEADAIYKDEVAKLEAMKEASQRRAISASFDAQHKIEGNDILGSPSFDLD